MVNWKPYVLMAFLLYNVIVALYGLNVATAECDMNGGSNTYLRYLLILSAVCFTVVLVTTRCNQACGIVDIENDPSKSYRFLYLIIVVLLFIAQGVSFKNIKRCMGSQTRGKTVMWLLIIAMLGNGIFAVWSLFDAVKVAKGAGQTAYAAEKQRLAEMNARELTNRVNNAQAEFARMNADLNIPKDPAKQLELTQSILNQQKLIQTDRLRIQSLRKYEQNLECRRMAQQYTKPFLFY